MSVLLVIILVVTLCWVLAKYGALSAELDGLKNEQSQKWQEANNYYENKKRQGNLELLSSKQRADNIVINAQKEANNILDTAREKERIVNDFISSKIKDFPIVAEVMSDYLTAKDTAAIDYLTQKKNAGLKSAEEVREIKKEKRTLIAQNKAYKWELNYIRKLLPWLDELEDSTIAPYSNQFNADGTNDDAASYWLTPEEYSQLSTTEKYQRALDRYKKRHKSNVEIGRDYERYIGYLAETLGFTVDYFGIEKGVEDLGRDLICTRGNITYIVQCKCWSNAKKRVIHEKHINQHFGTTLEYFISTMNNSASFFNQDKLSTKIIPMFISTVPYSDTAVKFAKTLGVVCKQVAMEDYPMIKCNINRSTKEKIYHLPFDQQYDKCLIRDKGEFYAETVAEAEAAGFRRAKRWYGGDK